MGVSSFRRSHGIVVSKLINGLVDPVSICVLFIVTEIVADEQEYQNETGEADDQPGNIDQGIGFVPFDVS